MGADRWRADLAPHRPASGTEDRERAASIQVRHRLASGRLSEAWEYDSARHVLDVVLQQASANPIAFTLLVCAPDRARVGAHPIIRLDGDTWRVLPAVFRFEHDILVPHDVVLHEALGHGNALVLTHAPADVDAELEALCVTRRSEQNRKN